MKLDYLGRGGVLATSWVAVISDHLHRAEMHAVHRDRGSGGFAASTATQPNLVCVDRSGHVSVQHRYRYRYFGV
jgi:hypothetical protein